MLKVLNDVIRMLAPFSRRRDLACCLADLINQCARDPFGIAQGRPSLRRKSGSGQSDVTLNRSAKSRLSHCHAGRRLFMRTPAGRRIRSCA